MKIILSLILFVIGCIALSFFFLFNCMTLVIAIVGWETVDTIYNSNGTITLHVPVTDKDRQSVHFLDSQIWPWFGIAPFAYIALLIYIILFTKFDISKFRGCFKRKPKGDTP